MERRAASVTLVLGGVRSGKSSFAADLARQCGEPVLFLATAEAWDAEMAARIAAHRASRPAGWQTLEAPVNLADAVRRAALTPATILLDSLTQLVANHLDARSIDPAQVVAVTQVLRPVVRAEVDGLCAVARDLSSHLVVVSDEVGMGLVPPYPSGRLFCDLLGEVNQRLAQVATAVYLVVAGLPVELKRSSS